VVLIWMSLMIVGVLISLPWKRRRNGEREAA
jgi:hypothetical protein